MRLQNFTYLMVVPTFFLLRIRGDDTNASKATQMVEKIGFNATSSLCDYEATCSAGGLSGVCVSISSGCCSGGTATAGLCPGSSDIKCCTSAACSTPSGSGSCQSTDSCSGSSIPGYCSGPANIQCCVSSPHSNCILGEPSGCDEANIASGIRNQIIAEMESMGYSFTTLDSAWARCSTPCSLQSSAASSLQSATSSVNDYITINSAYRSSAEQYLLYTWYQKGMCGITLAATPGSSNHESGGALDTSNYNYWIEPLAKYGWVHTYPSSDPVHFDYSGVSNVASQNLLAFQRLWNRHNPSSPIDEDGQYGPQTENALYHAPCSGW